MEAASGPDPVAAAAAAPPAAGAADVPRAAPAAPAAPPEAPLTARPSDFILLRVLGRGAFGKVLQVAHRATGRVYAMKVYSKRFLAAADQLAYTVTERAVMARLEHAFVVRLRYAFQTASRLFLLSDYCAGGELFNTLRKHGTLLEAAARVYLAEIVLALEHCHAAGVAHRDLKVRAWARARARGKRLRARASRALRSAAAAGLTIYPPPPRARCSPKTSSSTPRVTLRLPTLGSQRIFRLFRRAPRARRARSWARTSTLRPR